VVTSQPQVKRRTAKVRLSETDVLPLCHATNITQYTTCTVLNFLTHSQPFLPGLPVYLQGLIRGRTAGTQPKHEEPDDKKRHFIYTLLILNFTRDFVNLTHASQCIATSRPAAATQTRARVSPAMHSEVFLRLMPFLLQPSLFPGLETGSEYAGLHTLRLGRPKKLNDKYRRPKK